MKVGIPKGLLYYKYHPFIETFFTELGAEIITSPDTNKEILDAGVRYSIDDACFPVKIFHGHVVSIKDKCDMIFIPRIMQLRKDEFICPKFCGLTEMVVNDIPDMPFVLGEPIYAYNEKLLSKWAMNTGKSITHNSFTIHKAFNKALKNQVMHKFGINQNEFPLKVALMGHPYNIYDPFTNMSLIKKLNKLNIGVITEEAVQSEYTDKNIEDLFKKPFWTFARNSLSFSTYSFENHSIDGCIYISSFSCGIDSVVIELIQERISDLPILVLKIDEHTGEAGFNTRIEAFADMLERSDKAFGYNFS